MKLRACDDRVHDGLLRWYALRRASFRFFAAHGQLVARIEHGPPLAEPMRAGVRETLAAGVGCLERVEKALVDRARDLLRLADALELHASRRRASIRLRSRAAIGEFAVAVALAAGPDRLLPAAAHRM